MGTDSDSMGCLNGIFNGVLMKVSGDLPSGNDYTTICDIEDGL